MPSFEAVALRGHTLSRTLRRVAVAAVPLVLAAAGTVFALSSIERDIQSVNISSIPALEKSLPSTSLDLSVLGRDGKSIPVKARTDEQGRLNIRSMSWDQWRPESAFDGKVLHLPDSTLATIQPITEPFVPSTTFALSGGRVVDLERYIHDLASPFSLLCRSDEGPPRSLATGDRFSYEVPGSETNLKQVLAERFVYDPYVFKLPGELGYGVSSAGGPAPQETWQALQGLARDGRIRGLELDSCWEFLPNGSRAACTPSERPFPDKAHRISGEFSGRLDDRYAQVPLGDAFVYYAPLSPTPFFDPGERPGDERPPTFVRTGADGSYQATLDDSSGPIEIGVAKGCAQHTTVAIAEGPGTKVPTVLGLTTERKPEGAGSTTPAPPSGPQSTPPGTPPASKPPAKPNPNQRICGPDVTDYVLGVLELMRESYQGWSEDERSRRCGALYSLRSFNYAWDMQGFAPSDAGEPEGKPGYMEYIFFQRAAPGYCAVPRWPCGATVQFLGRCIHAQVVNYVQWGLMNQLCDTQVRGELANLLRSGFSTHYAGQHGMSLVGRYFGIYGDRPLAERKSRLKHLLDILVENDPAGWNKIDGFDCALACDKYAPPGMKSFLDSFHWGFAWGAKLDNIPITRPGRDLAKP